jgi:DNA repair exonuclease SbcCD ATPase subunit
MEAIQNMDDDDDMSPLKAALDKAKARADRLTEAREEKELEALRVAVRCSFPSILLWRLLTMLAANFSMTSAPEVAVMLCVFPEVHKPTARDARVQETAIGERDRLENVKKEVERTEYTMAKREAQLKKMAKQKDSIEGELSRYMESDALASVDQVVSQDAASVGARRQAAAAAAPASDALTCSSCSQNPSC